MDVGARSGTVLPTFLTSFVGREREVPEVARLVRSSRLVTLTGAGGSGKTRLALEAAAGLRDECPDGVWLVELAQLSDEGLVPQVLADRLGVREESGRALLDSVVLHFHERVALVVLDNCEHLVDACARITETLLQRCPSVRVLATSREPLGVPGEVAWRVPPLSLPYPEHLPALDALGRCEAVQLFVDRAGRVRPGFTLDEGNAGAVADICYRLDGLPLGIELAAARVAALEPDEIAARLARAFGTRTGGLDLLASTHRTLTPRHRTLRAAIDWSYDLLDPPDQTLIARLGVFAGGWTIEAAEAVCTADDGLATRAVLDDTARLVDRSLVVAEADAGRTRYRLLETIREYARERLDTTGQLGVTRRRHAEYYADLVARAAPHLWGATQTEWAPRLGRDHDNIRAALAYLADGDDEHAPGPDDLRLGLRLAGHLVWYWSLRGYWTEGRRWLLRFLAAAPVERNADRLRALQGAGWLAHVQDDGAAARVLLAEGHNLAETLGDQRAVAWGLHVLGRTHYFDGDYTAARVSGERSLALARELGDEWVAGWALQLLARAAHLGGDYPAARAHYEESLTVRRRIGDRAGVSMCLGLMGMLAYHRGDLIAARALTAESLSRAGEVAFDWLRAIELAAAACILERQGDLATAVRLAAAATSFSGRIGAAIIPDVRRELTRFAEDGRRRLGEAVYQAAWDAGQRLTVEEAVALALARFGDAATVATSGPLSAREAEVAALVAQGYTNRQIAERLVISTRTADRHVANILDKLGVVSRVEMAVWARQHLPAGSA